MSENILNQIEKFIIKSEESKIDWKFVNANAVRFTKSIGIRVYTATIQKQSVLNALKPFYIFTVQITNPNEVLLQVQSQTSPEYTKSLEDLFTIALASSQKGSFKEIDDLLDSL